MQEVLKAANSGLGILVEKRYSLGFGDNRY
jgi:hypothetical protein